MFAEEYLNRVPVSERRQQELNEVAINTRRFTFDEAAKKDWEVAFDSACEEQFSVEYPADGIEVVLPKWIALIDPASKYVYWENQTTYHTQWENPYDFSALEADGTNEVNQPSHQAVGTSRPTPAAPPGSPAALARVPTFPLLTHSVRRMVMSDKQVSDSVDGDPASFDAVEVESEDWESDCDAVEEVGADLQEVGLDGVDAPSQRRLVIEGKAIATEMDSRGHRILGAESGEDVADTASHSLDDGEGEGDCGSYGSSSEDDQMLLVEEDGGVSDVDVGSEDGYFLNDIEGGDSAENSRNTFAFGMGSGGDKGGIGGGSVSYRLDDADVQSMITHLVNMTPRAAVAAEQVALTHRYFGDIDEESDECEEHIAAADPSQEDLTFDGASVQEAIPPPLPSAVDQSDDPHKVQQPDPNDEWQELFDETHGCNYYYNSRTQQYSYVSTCLSMNIATPCDVSVCAWQLYDC